MKKVLLVSGKLYFDLVKERHARGLEKEVAIIRIEELCPFPFSDIRSALSPFLYNPGVSLAWVQEEPQNQGAWMHIWPRVENVLKQLGFEGRISFVGRATKEVPAVGVGKMHTTQVQEILSRALATKFYGGA